MDEVWKDHPGCTLSSLNQNPHAQHATAQHGLILQDFLNPAASGTGQAQARASAGGGPGDHPSAAACFEFEALPSTPASNRLKLKRMMNNRESAARSRARKMAYTVELEKEVSQLMQENASLRTEIQHQKLFPATASIEKEAPQKCNLSRSLSSHRLSGVLAGPR